MHCVFGNPFLNLPSAVREWYLLAANWNQGGMNVWIRPQALTPCEGMVWILADTGGVNLWGIRIADSDIDDPPVFVAGVPNEVFQSFSQFVAAMIVNDVLFPRGAVQLNRESARAELMCLVTSTVGDFFADAPLESATVVMFAYPGNGPVYGKARTPAGNALLQRLRLQTA